MFALWFARTATGGHRDLFWHYYAQNVKIKDFNVLIDGKSFFDLPVKNEEEAYQKVMSDDRNNDYATVNLLNFANFKHKRLYTLDSKSKSGYSHVNPIKFLTKSIESGLCDYSDAYILVTGDIVVKRRNTAVTADIALGAIAQVAFKIYPPFKDCRTEINDNSIDFADLTKIKRRI